MGRRRQDRVHRLATAPQSGDLGWIEAEDSQEDEAYLAALFAAEPNTPTAVVEGADGIFRIGRVTEIAPETVDADYQAKLQNDGHRPRQVPRGRRRRRHPREARGEDRRGRHEARAAAPTSPRSTSNAGAPEVPARRVKIRHILYSPKDDAQGAAGRCPRPIPPGRPPRPRPRPPTRRLVADPDLFDAIARAESDEGQRARAPADRRQAAVLRRGQRARRGQFKAAILAPGLKPGEILAPVKTDFGWHVIQVMYAPDGSRPAGRAQGDRPMRGADFAVLARDNSEAPDAEPRRRHRLGRQGPARRARDDSDLRGRGRQDDRRRDRGRGRDLPVQGLPRRSGRRRAGSWRRSRLDGVRRLVHGQEGRRHDHAGRRPSRARPARREVRCSTRSSPRPGCAGGLIRPTGSRSRRRATHREPDRGVAAGPDRAARRSCGAATPQRPSERPLEPLPGRQRAAVATSRLRVLRRAVSGRSPRRPVRAARDDDHRRPDRRRTSTGRSTSPRSPRSSRSPGRGPCRGSAPGCASPTAVRGTASRPTRRCASTCSRRRTRSTTRSKPGPRPALAEELGDLLLQVVLHAQLAAEAGVFDLADVQAGARDEDRPPPPARLRRRRGRGRRRREPPVGADQGRGACRRRAADAAR